MAKFLTTTGNSYFIEQIILNAESSLTIITPYLKLNRTLIDRLKDADKLKIRITLIYGKSELHENEMKTLNTLRNLEIYFCSNLHAKCYHNESSLIISSMNLYEFSEKNNREMGILIEKSTDNEIYNDTLKEIESIKNASNKQKSVTSDEFETNKPDSVLFEFDPQYKDLWDFHLPAVYKLLLSKYPNSEIRMKGGITLNDFPKNGIVMEITGRIDLHFGSNYNYKYLKNRNSEKFRSLLPGVRFFWNKKSLNIYLELKFNDEVSNSGIERKAKRFLEIINTVYEKIEL